MKINWKDQLKLSFIYTVVGAIPPFLQVLIQPIIEGRDRLDTIQFSYLAITESISTLAFTIALFAMSGALQRFYYDYRSDQIGYNKLVSTTFISIVGRGILLLGVAIIASPYIGKIFSQAALQDFDSYGYYAIIIGINRAVNISAITLYRNEKRIKRFILVNLFLAISRIIFQLIGIFYWDMSFIGLLQGNMVGGGIISLFILFLSFKQCGIRFDKKIFKEINKFAFPLFQTSLITWGILFADRYFLESHPLDLSIYDTALKFALGLNLILQGLQGAFQPEIYRFMSLGFKKSEEQIKGLSNGLMAITQFLVALTLPVTMVFLHFFYDTDLKLAAGIIGIVFIKGIIRTQFIVFAWPIYFLKDTRFILHMNILVLVVNLSLNYILIPKYLAYGAISASIISDIVLAGGFYLKQKKLSQINWNKSKLIFFPLMIIMITVFMEFIKIQFDLNIFLVSAVSVLSIFSSLALLYRNEIMTIYHTKIAGFLKR